MRPPPSTPGLPGTTLLTLTPPPFTPVKAPPTRTLVGNQVQEFGAFRFPGSSGRKGQALGGASSATWRPGPRARARRGVSSPSWGPGRNSEQNSRSHVSRPTGERGTQLRLVNNHVALNECPRPWGTQVDVDTRIFENLDLYTSNAQCVSHVEGCLLTALLGTPGDIPGGEGIESGSVWRLW